MVYIKAQTPLPAYFPYPKFLLQMSLSHTARLTYVLLLDRMTLSQKNALFYNLCLFYTELFFLPFQCGEADQRFAFPFAQDFQYTFARFTGTA